MIEIVYKEENTDTDSSIDIKMPKNIKQIGEGDTSKKIYIEDYVINFIKQTPKDDEDVKYGVLLGDVKRGNGNTYIFISGAVVVKESMDKAILFNGEIWTDIYEDIRSYFNHLEIAGWFASFPFNDKGNLTTVRKIHLDNFAGNDKVFFEYDRAEEEEGFYLYEAGVMSKQESYYIYYERNEYMQEYLVDNNISQEAEPSQPIKREGSYRTLILGGKEKGRRKISDVVNKYVEGEKEKPYKSLVNWGNPLRKKESAENSETIDPETKKIETKHFEKHPQKKISSLASSFLIILLLLAVIGVMENYGEMKGLKVSMQKFASGLFDGGGKEAGNNVTEEDGTVKVETVNGDVETTNDTETQASTAAGEETSTASVSQETTAPIQETTAPPQQKYYTVQEGESLYRICRNLYNDIGMVQEVVALNNLSSPDAIYTGQKLLLPK